MESRSTNRVAVTLALAAFVLVLVRFLVGTPDENSALNRAAATRLADRQSTPPDVAAADPAPTPTPEVTPRDDSAQEPLTMDAAPDEELIDEATGEEPSTTGGPITKPEGAHGPKPDLTAY